MADKEKNATQAPLPPISRRTLKSGLINKGAVAENEMPDSAVSESINMNFDAIGAAQVRKGSTLLGNNLGSAILGLYYFADTVGAPSYTQLIAVAATAVYYLAAGVWTSIRTGLTSGSQARFATLINMVFMVNGTEATEVWDGNPGGGFSGAGKGSHDGRPSPGQQPLPDDRGGDGRSLPGGVFLKGSAPQDAAAAMILKRDLKKPSQTG